MDRKAIASRLVMLRKEKEKIENRKISYSKIEEELNNTVDRSTVHKYENGEIPIQISKIIALAEYYDVSLDWLLTGDDRSKRKKASSGRKSSTNDLINDSNSSQAFISFIKSLLDNYRPIGKIDFDESDLKDMYESMAKIQNEVTKNTYLLSPSGDVAMFIGNDKTSDQIDAYDLYLEDMKDYAKDVVEEVDSGISFLFDSKLAHEFFFELTESLRYLDMFDELPLDMLEFNEDETVTYHIKKDVLKKVSGFEYIDYLEASEMHFDNALRLLRSIYDTHKKASENFKISEYRYEAHTIKNRDSAVNTDSPESIDNKTQSKED